MANSFYAKGALYARVGRPPVLDVRGKDMKRAGLPLVRQPGSSLIVVLVMAQSDTDLLICRLRL